jgi:hypothetical protein
MTALPRLSAGWKTDNTLAADGSEASQPLIVVLSGCSCLHLALYPAKYGMPRQQARSNCRQLKASLTDDRQVDYIPTATNGSSVDIFFQLVNDTDGYRHMLVKTVTAVSVPAEHLRAPTMQCCRRYNGFNAGERFCAGYLNCNSN